MATNSTIIVIVVFCFCGIKPLMRVRLVLYQVFFLLYLGIIIMTDDTILVDKFCLFALLWRVHLASNSYKYVYAEIILNPLQRSRKIHLPLV